MRPKQKSKQSPDAAISDGANKWRAAAALPVKFVRIQIIGPSGPVGKTMLQVAIKEFLEAKGVKVHLSQKEPVLGDGYQKGNSAMKEIAKFHKGSSLIPEYKNLEVAIDVIAT